MPPVNQPYVVVSDALAKFIGVQGTVPHDDALKYLWDYIKANQLEVCMCITFFFLLGYRYILCL
jgi:hypothetical protein